MIKFGIPSLEGGEDKFPGQSVLIVNSLKEANSKSRFTLSKEAAKKLGVLPGMSEVAFSFYDGAMLAVIPKEVEGVPAKDRYLVNKELSFTSKNAYKYICEKYKFDASVDNHLYINEYQKVENGLVVGTLTETPPVTMVEQVEENKTVIELI